MMNCLLIGPPQEGGEGVYVKEIFDHPPAGVRYSLTQEFHSGTDNARCNVAQEILLNRALHPMLRYGFGFRVLSLADDVDLVHVHSHPVKLRSRRRVPIVMSAGSSHYINVRDYEKWGDAKIRRRYALARALYAPLGIHDELLNAKSVARIYTFSHWAREIYVRHGIPAEKIDVVYPGFEVPKLPERAKRGGAVRFLFVGRDFARKGGPLVVAAFERLRSRHHDVTLTVVTRNGERVPPTDGMVVLPFMDRTKLYENVYPAADVFVMPTEAEGWGFTNAEAMSFGLPVISTSINAIPEVVENEVCGLLVPPNDADALHGAMERLVEDPAVREEMGDRARQRFVERFSRDAFRATLGEFYDKALRC
jgi:glycosyltransferase involved in cell wall biosynthesis